MVSKLLTHNSPEAQELAPGASRDVFDERSRFFPVPEADARRAWNAAEVDHQSENDEEDDEEDLDQGEPEFDLTIDSDG